MDGDKTKATPITDWKNVFVKHDPEATNHIKQQQLQYWNKRNTQTLQALQNYSNTHNTDGMADEAKHAMEGMGA